MNTPALPTASPRWRRLLPLFTLLPTISLILSGVITWINLGWVDGFVTRWLLAFLTALPVLPVGLIGMLALDRALRPRMLFLPHVGASLILALLNALIMGTLMASAVTFSNHGLGHNFASQWATAFQRSFPVSLVISLLMSFVIKPRLARWTGVA
ncbi:MAG: DUF2798 domain-containing protein [Hydrogenophaga sp.]